MHSWRVLLLPYLGEPTLYAEYRFDEPWNSSHNLTLASRMPECYRCPSHGHHGEIVGDDAANYVVVVGPRTVFSGGDPVRLRDMSDGTSRTIMLVDVNQQAVKWTAPDDLSVDEFLLIFRSEAEFNHPSGLQAAFADVSVKMLLRDATSHVLQAMLTHQSNDEYALDDP